MRTDSWKVAIGLALVCGLLGCGQSGPAKVETAKPETKRPETYEGQVASVARPAVTVRPEEPKPSEPVALGSASLLEDARRGDLEMPQVKLADSLRETCRVTVGDSFPALELADLSGTRQTLAELRGSRLTVAVFWEAKQSASREELADLASPLIQKFSTDGVKVVAINCGDDPQLAKEVCQKSKAEFTCLSDPDRTALAQVATSRLPRTYLLDSDGRILWFDLEYSRSTRRDLVQAIRYALAQP